MSTPINDAVVPSRAERISDQSGAPRTRLRGLRLILARVVWVAAVTLIVVPFIAMLLANYTFLQTVCTGAMCGFAQPTPDSAQALHTLVYSTLTFLLAAVYEVSVFTLESLTSGLTLIRGNQLAIFASTLLIGLLFKPLHDRTKALIDRRFYRRKYDAARTLAAFSATVRDEVDLNQLCTTLEAVVEKTMQPTHVSLWLCLPKL